MKTMNLSEKINIEQQAVAKRLSELREQQKQDNKIMDTLKQQYIEAITSTTGNEIDSINDQIKEVAERIQRRKDIIEALSDHNNPVIQSMITEEIEGQLERLNDIESKTKSLYKALERQRTEMMKGLAALEELNKKNKSIQSYVSTWSNRLNDTNKEKLGLKGITRAGIDVFDFINKLLIERVHVYK
ncbi:hypothetical protein [Paenibacillus lutimineralis]|uniref:Uncharacterized protein n=1 Tax=Paenibacillus lutimineralis TaxID=2707005 RepID=A0A3S9UW95_9BACL|nr:hypothetical protein [Paenibacillus lutimineralis]AZS14573.1 hypothetical protein EI981_08990 [Paenibacillus lutimineralis]